ncbi:hypothetical protein [Maricaulis sp.]|uniref:hypothetical protein n=1 Tax=Maricaulis sp. TaxID=1486257 RepID=UPI003A90882E
MLSDADRAREIKRRKGAGALEIPKSYPDERLIAMETVGETLYLFSQHNIFRVRTADEIDPEVTQVGVPWAVNPYLSIGTKNSLIAGSFGVLRQTDKAGIDAGAKDKILCFLMEFAVSAAELEYAREIYEGEVDRLQSDEGAQPLLVKSAIQMPRITAFEISFSIFFSAAKRCVGKLMAVLEWAAFFPVTNGSRLDKFCHKAKKSKKLSDHHHLIDRIEGFSEAVRLLNEIRNAFEHPGSDRNVVLKNIELLPSGNFRMPTFTLVHDELNLTPDQDYGAHVVAAMRMISGLAELVVMVASAMRGQTMLAWEGSLREPSSIDPDFPTRWIVNVGLPEKVVSTLAENKG